MEVTGDEVLEWIDVHGWIISEWQRDLILRLDWSKPFEPLGPLRPEPRQPVQTRRVQRRRQTRAGRRRARKLPQPRHLAITDELTRQPQRRS